MRERARLEEKLEQVQADLEEASRSFSASVDSVADALGSRDTSRVTAAKETMQLSGETLGRLGEEERTLQRRLDHLATAELSRAATKAAKSASRAAWASFWVALFAMIAWTAAMFMSTVVYTAR